jgi:hypothetical protein
VVAGAVGVAAVVILEVKLVLTTACKIHFLLLHLSVFSAEI